MCHMGREEMRLLYIFESAVRKIDALQAAVIETNGEVSFRLN